MFWPPPLPTLLQLEKALGQRVAAARCKKLGWEAACQGCGWAPTASAAEAPPWEAGLSRALRWAGFTGAEATAEAGMWVRSFRHIEK